MKRPRLWSAPAISPAASPEPAKMSPRAGPTMAEPVSCGDHQPAPRRAIGERRFDEDRRAEAVDQAVDGEAPAFGQRHLGGGDWPERRILDRRLAEEDEGAVTRHQSRGLGMVVGKPRADGAHGGAALLERAHRDQLAADRSVGVAGLGGIGDAHLAAFQKAEAGRALDMDVEGIDRVGDPGDLEPLPSERAALFDLAAVEIGHQPLRRLPGEAVAGLDARRRIVRVDLDEVGRRRIERGAEFGRGLPGARRGGAADLIPELPVLVGDHRPPALHAASRGESRMKRPRLWSAPAISPAASPEPVKMSPRAGPTIAEPVSCGDHQAAPRRAVGERRFDEDRRAEAVDQAVDGEAPAFRQRAPWRRRRARAPDPRPAPRGRR